MSKSLGNGVDPMEVIDEYGTDVARLHVHFLGGYEDNTPWTFDGISGITSFINKVWDLQDMIKGEEISKEHECELNKLIKKVSEDLENLKLNTSIASLMSFINIVRKDGFITKEELRTFLILLNPLAPHITSEIYEIVFKDNLINDEWPKYDEAKIVEEEKEIGVQVNGKLRATIKVNINDDEETLKEKALKADNVIKHTEGHEIVKVIAIKGKIVNIVVK